MLQVAICPLIPKNPLIGPVSSGITSNLAPAYNASLAPYLLIHFCQFLFLYRILILVIIYFTTSY